MAVPDFQDSAGEWVRGIKGEKGTTYTYLGALLGAMKSRCADGGAVQKGRPSYIGCSYEFTSFKDFADWAVIQVGYGLPNYHLDKDLLSDGGKVYSKTTCVFIPRELNTLLLNRGRDRGKYPVGVCYHKLKGKFSAACNNGGKNKHLGYFDTPEEAFYVYKEYKEAVVRITAEKYKDAIDERAYLALLNFKVKIND